MELEIEMILKMELEIELKWKTRNGIRYNNKPDCLSDAIFEEYPNRF